MPDSEAEIRSWLHEQDEHWHQLNKTLPPRARMSGVDSCTRCSRPCWVRPGFLSEDDLKRLAHSFEISESEFFRTYAKVDEVEEILTLVLRRRHQPGGGMVSALQSHSVESPCVFLDEETRLCRIHEVKPETCRRFACWDPEKSATIPVWEESQLRQLGWDGLEDTEG